MQIERFGCESGPWGMNANVTFHLGSDGRTLCGRTTAKGRWRREWHRLLTSVRKTDVDCQRCQAKAVKLGWLSEKLEDAQ